MSYMLKLPSAQTSRGNVIFNGYIYIYIYIHIYIYIYWDSLQARLNRHYKAWSYKKNKKTHKRLKHKGNLFREILQSIGVCLL